MLKLSKNLRSGLIQCVARLDRLRSLVAAQSVAIATFGADLEVIRADLQAIREDGLQSRNFGGDLQACSVKPGDTDFVRYLEDVAAGAGGASNAVGLLAGAAGGATWPPVGELGMVGLLRADPHGQVRGLTEAELSRWLAATGRGLIAAGQGLVAHSRRADLCATVTHLGRFAQ